MCLDPSLPMADKYQVFVTNSWPGRRATISWQIVTLVTVDITQPTHQHTHGGCQHQQFKFRVESYGALTSITNRVFGINQGPT